ncbi:unnamed protein product [Chrysoparadoxa australica]
MTTKPQLPLQRFAYRGGTSTSEREGSGLMGAAASLSHTSGLTNLSNVPRPLKRRARSKKQGICIKVMPMETMAVETSSSTVLDVVGESGKDMSLTPKLRGNSTCVGELPVRHQAGCGKPVRRPIAVGGDFDLQGSSSTFELGTMEVGEDSQSTGSSRGRTRESRRRAREVAGGFIPRIIEELEETAEAKAQATLKLRNLRLEKEVNKLKGELDRHKRRLSQSSLRRGAVKTEVVKGWVAGVPEAPDELELELGDCSLPLFKWTEDLTLQWKEVESLICEPVTSNADLTFKAAALEAGLIYLDHITTRAEQLGVRRSHLLSYLAPHTTSICQVPVQRAVEGVLASIPLKLSSQLSKREVSYMVRGARSLARLLNLRIRRASDMKRAREALLLMREFFQRLSEEARRRGHGWTPFSILEERRGMSPLPEQHCRSSSTCQAAPFNASCESFWPEEAEPGSVDMCLVKGPPEVMTPRRQMNVKQKQKQKQMHQPLHSPSRLQLQRRHQRSMEVLQPKPPRHRRPPHISPRLIPQEG